MNATPRNSRPEAVESKISLQVLRQLSVKYADETKNLKDNRLEESDKQQLFQAIAEAESYKADLAGSDLSGADADLMRRLSVFALADQDFVSHFKAHVDGTYPQLNEVTWADFAGNLQAFIDALDAARTYFDGQASGVAMTDVNSVQIDNRKERRLETAFGGKIENNPELLGEFVAKLSEGSDSYADLYRMMSVRSPKEKVEQLAYLYRLVNQRADKIRESLNPGQRVRFDELITRIREDVDVEFELSGGGRLERWNHVVTVVQPDGTEAYYWDDDRRGLGGDEDPWEILDTENPQESLRLACEFDEDGDMLKGELVDYINYKDKLDKREARKARAAELEKEADESFRTPLANKIADLTEEYVLQKGREGSTGEIADDFARSRGRERVAAEIYVELMDLTKPVKPTDSANEEGMDDYRKALKAYDDRLKLFAGAVRVRPAARSHIERKISNMILNTVYVGKGRYNVFKDETEGALTFDAFQEKFPGAVDGVNDILLALLPSDKKNDPAARHQLILDLYKAIETRGSGSREAMVLYRRATMFIPNAWHESNFEQLLSVLKHYEDRDRQPKVWSLQETHGGWERIEGSEVTGAPAQAYLDVDLGNYQDAMAILRDNYRDLPTMLREKGANTVEYKAEIHGLMKVLCQQFRYFGNNDFAAVKEHYMSHPELMQLFKLTEEKIATLYAVYGLMKDARFEDWGALYKYLLYIEEDTKESLKVPRVRFMEGPTMDKLSVAVVDVEEKIRKISRRLAEERYEREMGQLIQDRKGASWFKKPWHFLKGYGRSIARQGFVDKYEAEYAEKLKNEPNFFEEMMSGEAGGELASHKAEVNAILNRFEMGDVTAEEVIADVEGEVYMQDLDNLAKAYLIGDVDDVEFGRRATRMVYQIRREHIIGAEAEGTDDKLVATDVVERMRDLKRRHVESMRDLKRRHVQGIVNLDLDNFRIALKVGKAMNVDVHSEVSTTRADGWVKGLQTWSAKHSMLKWFASPSAASIGAYAIVNSAYNLFASTTGRVAVGGVLGIIAAPAIGPAAAAALTGIAVGAGMAALHRNRSVIMQEAQKNRRQALGHYEQAADGTFEYKLGQVTSEKVAATDLIANIDQAIAAGDYQAIARAVAEIEVRNEMSYEERSERKGGKVDVIKFSDEKHVERERTAMLAKARAGRNWMESNHDPEDNVEDDLKAAATAVRDGIDNMIVGKDKEFRSLKFRENMKAASIGALFGLATSAAGYGLSVAVNKIWGPFGHDVVLNSDALADIKKFVDDNGLDPHQVAYGANGELTPASIAYLEAHGIHVNPIGTSAGCPEVSAYGPPDTSEVVTLPSGDTVTLEYPHDYPMPATIDQAWLDAHCSVTIVPGSGGSFSGSGANVLTHLEGSGVLTHAEVVANPGWVDSSGNLTTAGVTALNGKGVGIVYNPGPSSVVTSTATIPTGSLTDVQWKSLGFERETLVHHWHNGTPKVFENPHELNLWWGTKGGVDAHGDVVLTIDQMLKGGAGPTRVAGGGQLDVSAAFSRGELSLYAAVKDGSGHLRYMPFPIKADGSVTFDSTVGRMLWDTSGPKPKFLGEYVMCAQEAGGKLSSLAKVDGSGALGGLEVITEKTVTGDGLWKVAWESAGEKSYSFSSDEMIPGDCPNIPYAFTKEGTHDIYIMPPIVVKNPNALEKIGKTEREQNGLVDKYGNLVAANGDPLDMNIVRTTYTDPIGSSPWTEWDWGTLLDEDEVPPVDSGDEPDSGVEPIDSGDEPDSGIEPIDSGVEPAHSGVEPIDSGVEPAHSGVEPIDSGVEPAHLSKATSSVEFGESLEIPKSVSNLLEVAVAVESNPDIDAVSFDFMNTLALWSSNIRERRSVMHSNAVAILAKHGVNTDLKTYKAAWKEVRATMNAEFEPKAQDYKLIDALRLIVDRVAADSGASLDKSTVEAVSKALEEDIYQLKYEAMSAAPEAEEAIRRIRKAGKKVVVYSNAYYSQEHIEESMKRLGLMHNIDYVFSSCDLGARKDVNNPSGFLKVAEAIGVDPSRILHIGDAISADYNGAKKAGFQAIHLHQSKEASWLDLMKMKPGSPEYAEAVIAFEKRQLDAGRDQFVNGVMQNHESLLSPDVREGAERSYEIGRDILGPVIAKFCHNVLLEAAESPGKYIYCMGRDGQLQYIMMRALLNERPDLYPGIDESRVKYVNVSRKLVHKALADAGYDTEPGTGRKVSEFSRRAEYVGMKDKLIDYLRSQGLDEAEEIVVVDSGMVGSTQNVFQVLCPEKKFVGRYLTYQKYTNSPEQFNDKTGYLYESDRATRTLVSGDREFTGKNFIYFLEDISNGLAASNQDLQRVVRGDREMVVGNRTFAGSNPTANIRCVPERWVHPRVFKLMKSTILRGVRDSARLFSRGERVAGVVSDEAAKRALKGFAPYYEQVMASTEGVSLDPKRTLHSGRDIDVALFNMVTRNTGYKDDITLPNEWKAGMARAAGQSPAKPLVEVDSPVVTEPKPRPDESASVYAAIPEDQVLYNSMPSVLRDIFSPAEISLYHGREDRYFLRASSQKQFDDLVEAGKSSGRIARRVRKIVITGSSVSSIEGVGIFSGLRQLSVNRSSVSDISPVSNCSDLVRVNLMNSKVSDYSSLLKLSGLTIIDKEGNVSKTPERDKSDESREESSSGSDRPSDPGPLTAPSPSPLPPSFGSPPPASFGSHTTVPATPPIAAPVPVVPLAPTEPTSVEAPAPAAPTDLDTLRRTETRSFGEVTTRLVPEGDPTAEEILSRAQIHATSYKGEMLTVDDIRRAGLGPKEKISFNGTDVYVSDSYDIGDGRTARIGYVRDTRTGDVVARSFYRSNSMGLWRFLAGYTTDQHNGEISWYGKAWSEESTTLPSKLQKALCQDSSPVKHLAEPDKLFAGLARGHSITDTWRAQIDRRSRVVDGTFYADNPERVLFSDPQDEPDFAHTIESFETQTSHYGVVHVDVFLSANGKYRYMMCNDGKRAWMAGGEIVGAKVTPLGANENWINLGNMTIPAYEYSSQIDSRYHGARVGEHYVDVFDKYLSRIPVIRRYCEASGIALSRTNQSEIDPSEYDIPTYIPGPPPPDRNEATPVDAKWIDDDEQQPASSLDAPSPPTSNIGGEPVSRLVPNRGEILPSPLDDTDRVANTGPEIDFFTRGDAEDDEVLPPLPPVRDDDESLPATL